MKGIMRFILGGAAGFLTAYIVLNFSDLDFATDIFVIALFVITAVLMIISLVRYNQVKKLSEMTLTGDEEDEANASMYMKYSDYSLCVHSSIVVSVLALSLSIIAMESIFFTIVSIVLVVINCLFGASMFRVMRYASPERKIPELSDPNSPKDILDIADDGEKDVMLIGLNKAYNVLNTTLILAIIFATFYSISNSSQIFSIIAMSVVLLLVNGKYLLAVRNK
ncbi:DUF3169 family protein [Lentibacillus sediminis]|uniref:DUF3169 family protein n=1 Tax=Lentibacillus sediminis TaxID=1940529 RepID=UPI000C1C0883|nr:DUF3169 family protein [Lentibacillus sediminis]